MKFLYIYIVKTPLIYIAILILFQFPCTAQTDIAENPPPFFLGPKPDYHRFYIGVRFPQTYYFNSDLRLFGPVQQYDYSMADFDVTIHSLKSADEGFVYAALFKTIFQNAPAPPFVISFGFKFKNSNFGITGRIMHYKQFMIKGQKNLINGSVGNDIYNHFYGEAPFLKNYENSDGHNIYSLGAEFIYTMVQSKNKKHGLDVNAMIGPGISYPRTDATIVTPNGTIRQRNNDFKVAGAGMVFEIGFMGTIFNHLTFTLEGNFTIIHNANMFIITDENNNLRGSQTISAFSWSTGLAFTFPFKPYKKLRQEAQQQRDSNR